MQEVSYVRDFLATLAAGLIMGLSPGFRIPPKRAVEEAETIEDEGHDPENGAHNAIIRTVHHALLYEISAVTRPAYDEAQIEARNWSADGVSPGAAVNLQHLRRWKA
ncbi:HK97 family phage prohead protease [uncultured Roseobacter sp.]|uniref:HK97 family phage prohead protease n=1 Tax=uncultured Roseobacter sp. TaxID=114847 RepID=UPI002634D447|nr:HK97 family phage prohead protease [uncultured Roseobacter sp.]